MRPINKAKTPTLAQRYKELFKKEANPDFETLKKEAGNYLPHALAKEQGFICCYCMSEITVRTDKDGNIMEKDGLPLLAMKIEHFKSQKNHASAVTDYDNLLCACEGGCVSGEKKGKEHTYCDSHKLDDDFSFLPNPASVKTKDFERRYQLKYNYQGRISSDNEEIDKELNTILNLNYQTLRKMREAAWDRISSVMARHCKKPNWDDGEEKAKTLIEQYQKPRKNDDKFFPYCEMIVFLLKKRFKNIS